MGLLQHGHRHAGPDHRGRLRPVVRGFLKQRVFDPLGMADTCFYPTTSSGADRRDLRQVGRQAGRVARATSSACRRGEVSDSGRRAVLDGRRPGPALSDDAQPRPTRRQADPLARRACDDDARADRRAHTGFVPGMGFGFGWGVVREPQGVTAMLSPGTFGHGGAFGTQGWIDPHKDLFVILLIQRIGLPNGDASDMRREFQTIAVSALSGHEKR